jgi:hypothetical protein
MEQLSVLDTLCDRGHVVKQEPVFRLVRVWGLGPTRVAIPTPAHWCSALDSSSKVCTLGLLCKDGQYYSTGVSFSPGEVFGVKLYGFAFLLADPAGRTAKQWEHVRNGILRQMGLGPSPLIESTLVSRLQEVCAVKWYLPLVRPPNSGGNTRQEWERCARPLLDRLGLSAHFPELSTEGSVESPLEGLEVVCGATELGSQRSRQQESVKARAWLL